jgi:hypothetical protein
MTDTIADTFYLDNEQSVTNDPGTTFAPTKSMVAFNVTGGNVSITDITGNLLLNPIMFIRNAHATNTVTLTHNSSKIRCQGLQNIVLVNNGGAVLVGLSSTVWQAYATAQHSVRPSELILGNLAGLQYASAAPLTTQTSSNTTTVTVSANRGRIAMQSGLTTAADVTSSTFLVDHSALGTDNVLDAWISDYSGTGYPTPHIRRASANTTNLGVRNVGTNALNSTVTFGYRVF